MTSERPIRNQDILVKELGNETLLYSSEGKAIHVLNTTARFIWDLCDGEHSAEDMEGALRLRFDVSQDFDVIQDVRGILDDLVQKDLIHTS